MGIFENMDRDKNNFLFIADKFIEAERQRQKRLAKWEENYFFEKDKDDDE